MCARMMRQILVDHARARGYQKRGGDAAKIPLDDVATVEALQLSPPTIVRDWSFARAWLSSYVKGQHPDGR